MKANFDKPERKGVRPLRRSDLSDRVAYVMPGRDFIDGIFKSDSELDEAIVKLVLYCVRFMSFDLENMASKDAQDAAKDGLMNRQIRYFFKSHELPDERYQERYDFLDKARERLLKHGLISDSLIQKQAGNLDRHKLNKHLSKLVLKSVLSHEGVRYLPGASLLAPTIVAYYKRMLSQIPAEWMVPPTADLQALIVYNSLGLRERTPDRFNAEVFHLCEIFGKEFDKIWTRYKDQKPDPKPTIIITPGRIFDEQ